MGGVEVPLAPSGWGVASPLGERTGEGAVRAPFPENISYFFVKNTTFLRILTRLFLKSYANGRGSNPPPPYPLTHSSVRHWLTPSQRLHWLAGGRAAISVRVGDQHRIGVAGTWRRFAP